MLKNTNIKSHLAGTDSASLYLTKQGEQKYGVSYVSLSSDTGQYLVYFENIDETSGDFVVDDYRDYKDLLDDPQSVLDEVYVFKNKWTDLENEVEKNNIYIESLEFFKSNKNLSEPDEFVIVLNKEGEEKYGFSSVGVSDFAGDAYVEWTYSDGTTGSHTCGDHESFMSYPESAIDEAEYYKNLETDDEE